MGTKTKVRLGCRLSPPLPPSSPILSIPYSSEINPLGIYRLTFLRHARDSGFTVARGQHLCVPLRSQNREFSDPCGEIFATTTKIKNQRLQNFFLHQFMSKRVLKKDPGLPSQIWDAYYPPSTLGTTLLWSAAGGEARTARDGKLGP